MQKAFFWHELIHVNKFYALAPLKRPETCTKQILNKNEFTGSALSRGASRVSWIWKIRGRTPFPTRISPTRYRAFGVHFGQLSSLAKVFDWNGAICARPAGHCWPPNFPSRHPLWLEKNEVAFLNWKALAKHRYKSGHEQLLEGMTPNPNPKP